MKIQEQKQRAAHHVVNLIESDMVVGLGSGSTATIAIERLGERLRAGALHNIVAIPTSEVTANLAQKHQIPLTTLEQHPTIDLTFDGADEVDPNLNLIKGGGGALLREKIVAQASRREVIIVDEAKLVSQLGTRWFIPVEVVPFGWRTQQIYLEGLGAEVELRSTPSGNAFLTDQGNYILDAQFGVIPDAFALARQLNDRVGIVEHGLFLDLATEVIVGLDDRVRILQKG